MVDKSSFLRSALLAIPVVVVAATAGTLSQAQAAGAYVTLSSFAGHPGVTLQVSGGGFSPSQALALTVGQSSTPVSTKSGVDGSFSVAVNLPSTLAQGALPILVTEQDNQQAASNTYYVQPFSPSLQLSTGSALPFSTVTVSGSGYAPGETVALTLGTMNTTVVADQSGSFMGASLVVPNVAADTYLVTGLGQSSKASSIGYLYVNGFFPSFSPSAYFLLPGQVLTFNGSGYAPLETVTVGMTTGATTTPVTTFKADATGSFKNAGGVTIPFSSAGKSATFVLAGNISLASSSVTLSVGSYFPNVSPSAYFILPGSSLSFIGSSFAPNDVVSVTEDTSTTVLSTITADATGSFKNAGAVTIPFSDAGANHTFHLNGSLSKSQSDASVTVGAYFPNASPSAYFVLPGTSLSFIGSSFAPNDIVSVTEDKSTTVLATITADALGAFKNAGTVTIPFSDGGANHVFHLKGSLSKTQTDASITVGAYFPNVSLSAYYLMPGSSLTFTGSSFAPNDVISVTEDKSTTVLSTITADLAGNFKKAGSLTVPFTDAGANHVYHLKGSLSLVQTDASVTVGQLMPLINPSAYYLRPGDMFSVAGTGFAPSEKVTLNQGTTKLATSTADLTGNVAFAGLTFPTSKKASLTFNATGLTSNATTTADIAVGAYYPYATANNYYVVPGSTVKVQGFNFAPGETVTITDGTSQTVTADAFGTTALVSFTVPFGGTTATNTVTLTGSTSNASASVPLTLAPFATTISPSTYYATPGTVVTFSGAGFVAGETVTATLNKAAIGTITADKNGNFAGFSSTLPYGTAANYSFTGNLSAAPATVGVGLASFYAGLGLDNYYAVGGTFITLTGSGFAPSETIALSFGATNLGTVTSDAKGSFSFPTSVPYAAAGDKKVTATGKLSGAVATTTFTQAPVYVSLQLGTYAGAPGTALTFIGTGYLPGETVEITTDRDSGVVYSFKADASGSFHDAGFISSASYLPGNLKLTATGTHSLTAQTIVYYVTGR